MPAMQRAHCRRPAALRVGICSRRRAEMLVDLIAPSLHASGHGAVVVAAGYVGISGRHAASGLRGIESGLPLRPAMAFELVRSLLILGLTILRIDDQIALRVVGRRRR